MEQRQAVAAHGASLTAFLYLRVSSPGQVNKDFDPEGYSIPGQREACTMRTRSLEALVIGEYVEYGVSGRDASKRPALQKMLADLRVARPDYVVIYDLSRLARNRLDDAMLLMQIEATGARLVSVVENIDKTPAGRLTHGVLAAVNEFRSAGDAEKVKMGLQRKFENGGTVGLAPTGYLNVRERVEGREVRTVEIDPERAPLIRMAFECFATGEYTLSALTEMLDQAGLRRRMTAKRAPAPLARSAIYRILRDDYYIGIVTYQGAKRQGRHPRLIDDATFERVQQILTAHALSGDRSYKHQHYLKGSVFCGHCGTRLAYGRHRGGGGVYEYFSCMSRSRPQGACGAAHMAVDKVEQAVERYYVGVRLTERERAALRDEVQRYADGREAAAERERARHESRLRELQMQQQKLLHLYFRDQISEELLGEEQRRIKQEQAEVDRWVEVALHSAEEVMNALDRALELLTEPRLRYEQATSDIRRLINQAIFEKLLIVQEWVTDAVLAPWVIETKALAQAVLRPAKAGTARKGAGNDQGPLFGGPGSYFSQMVRRRGLEPPPGYPGPGPQPGASTNSAIGARATASIARAPWGLSPSARRYTLCEHTFDLLRRPRRAWTLERT